MVWYVPVHASFQLSVNCRVQPHINLMTIVTLGVHNIHTQILRSQTCIWQYSHRAEVAAEKAIYARDPDTVQASTVELHICIM